MWNIDWPFDVDWSGKSIEPSSVLYEFDGPSVFVAKVGFIDLLFLKVDESDESEFYLATSTSELAVKALVNGNVSLRGAFLQSQYWLIETTYELSVLRHWLLSREHLPARFLPARSYPLSANMPFAPNSLSQAFAFFGMGFQGEQIDQSAMPFGIFKKLIDQAYDAARNILSPVLLIGSKSATFDFSVAQPDFGSLILSIKEPILNSAHVLKKFEKHAGKIEIEGVRAEFSTQKDAFFDAMDEIVDEASKGELSGALAEEQFSVLDRVQHVIPTGEGIIERAEFSSFKAGRTDSLIVGDKVGKRIHEAFKIAERRPIVETGKVEIVNSRQNSFVMLSARGRLVTCYVEWQYFDEIKNDPRFRTGARISVRGYLKRRRQRDLLEVSGAPSLL